MREEEERKTVTASAGKDSIVTSLKVRSHVFTCDETPRWGGNDCAPDPWDYILGGLASCVAISLRQFADRKKWPLDGAEVSCEYESIDGRGDDEKQDRIIKTVKLSGDLKPEQADALKRVADCPAHKMLERGIEIITRIR